jgi:hypothetical protein
MILVCMIVQQNTIFEVNFEDSNKNCYLTDTEYLLPIKQLLNAS